MVREDLIASAVQFLQDPSVASSPPDKKIAFLQSKNLTKEEVDLAFSRVGQEALAANSGVSNFATSSAPRSPAGYGYGYGYGNYPPPPWAAPPPPPPRRDWRDWFIMATVTSGVGYGLYTAAKRYVVPLIAPPTPPQLEQDKAAIDEEFNKAFALIDQLSADTAALKASEAERTEKLDSTIKEVDSVIADLKASNLRREAENRAVADQVRELKSLVPKALEGWKASGDAKLEELSQDMSSLKKLLENRVGRSTGSPQPNGKSTGALPVTGRNPPRDDVNASPDTQVSSGPARVPSPPSNGSAKGTGEDSSPRKAGGDRKAAIPAWQMAASNRSEASP